MNLAALPFDALALVVPSLLAVPTLGSLVLLAAMAPGELGRRPGLQLPRFAADRQGEAGRARLLHPVATESVLDRGRMATVANASGREAA